MLRIPLGNVLILGERGPYTMTENCKYKAWAYAQSSLENMLLLVVVGGEGSYSD